MSRVTVRDLIAELAPLDPDLEVWVADGSAGDGPAPGDPQELVVLEVEQ